MKRAYNTNQLMNKYRSVMNRVLDTDYETKASVLRMSMRTDGIDENMIDSMVHDIINENAAAINSIK